MVGMRTRSSVRVALHGLFAVWLAAVAVAPLWHSGHAAPPRVPEADGAPGHEHANGAWVCNGAPVTVDPAVDCVLCKARRLLSQYWNRTPGVSATLQATAVPALPPLFIPVAGEHVPLAARAPPLC